MVERYAHVAIQAGDQSLDHPFTYRLPEDAAAAPGQGVVAPLRGRRELGYILAITGTPDLPPDLCPPASLRSGRDARAAGEWKTILEVLDSPPAFDRRTASLLAWIARRYFCGLSDAVRSVIPPNRIANVRTLVRLPGAEASAARRPSPLAERVLETLREIGGEAELEDLQRSIRTPRLTAALRQLARRGSIEMIRVAEKAPTGKTAIGVRLAASSTAAEEWLASHTARRYARQKDVLDQILAARGQPVLQAVVMEQLGCSAAPIKSLVEAGILERVEISQRRNPWPDSPQIPLELPLTSDQTGALQILLGAVHRAADSWPAVALQEGEDEEETAETLAHAPAPEVVLLKGVTGSGKTEVYLQAIEETRRRGRQSLALVPEISLTAQMIGIFQSRFGTRVAVLHSKLSSGERLDEWERIRKGEVDVVIGARSALFAPVPNLGLIVLDEEHETSYKQDSSPRYLARDTAMERARLCGACLVLGSATPSLESVWMVEQRRAVLAVMPRRIDDRPLPEVILVDQRRELKENPGRIFSRRLEEAVRLRMSRREQAILFLNRRGFATITLCRDCGYVARCRNCDVSLTYYVSSRLLRCHHCEYTIAAPSICPKCEGVHIRQFGIGTEKVEAEIAALFPDARTARMDVDTTSRKGSVQDLVHRFRHAHLDILVGTQMVAKGFDFPGVTLVGVVSADTMLNLPDFRAAERTFQLLTQVSGRAGRGDRPGEVVVQTFNPDHYAVLSAARHDFDDFYRQELPHRREARYPPFVSLANLVVEGASRQEARSRAQRIGAGLLEAIGDRPVILLGPAPAPLSRIQNRFRWHLLLKSECPDTLREICQRLRLSLAPGDMRHLSVDLDPMSLL